MTKIHFKSPNTIAMGLLKFMAKIGSPGSTARVLAKTYHRIKDQYPEGKSDQDIFRIIIEERYKLIKNDNAKQNLLQQTGKMFGLKSLVISILGEEAGYYNNDFNTQTVFSSVIEEELRKKGVPEKLIQ